MRRGHLVLNLFPLCVEVSHGGQPDAFDRPTVTPAAVCAEHTERRQPGVACWSRTLFLKRRVATPKVLNSRVLSGSRGILLKPFSSVFIFFRGQNNRLNCGFRDPDDPPDL